MKRQGQTLSLKNLTKSNVWDIQENDVFRLWAQAERDADLRDNERHYIDVIKSAFTIEEVKVNRPEVIQTYLTHLATTCFILLYDLGSVHFHLLYGEIGRAHV